MKVLQSSIFRAICSIIVGALLIKYPINTATWLIVAIGVLFLLPGIISCLVYINARRKSNGTTVLDSDGNVLSGGNPPFPIVGIGSLLFGLLLAIRPLFVMDFIAYILGFILLLGAFNQLFLLIRARKISNIPFIFWICPTVILLIGLIALLRPMWIAGAPLIILGWCLLLYGVTEIINALKINAERRRFEHMLKKASDTEKAETLQNDAGSE